jgi:hypothetical protein
VTAALAAHETTRGVLLGALGVAVLAGALVWTLREAPRTSEPQAAFEAWFEPRDLPFGLQPVEAQELVRGDWVLRLERADLAPEPPRAESSSDAGEDSDDKSKDKPRFDWSKVDYGTPGAPPREVVIARLELEVARDELEKLFKGGEELRGDWAAIDSSGGKRIVQRGLVAWGQLDCAWAHERQFESGGTFRDVVRVNLSSAGEPRVLIARFGRGVAGSIAPVEQLLAALVTK